ncbi:hypothetical protein [Nocardia pseudobrasiliensis]|uniref:Uncharacterized protein n=1 Tax=Nocardia pseudobrasiliensis TaxID=45979 RepID=A0A370HWI0_9NOCA|nr:hypothetical protein [Nocardia pseudobrasiliensis]RDI62842.1 hypothetical protein DFR76_112160 [Nocardia pseudobrasiliensis]
MYRIPRRAARLASALVIALAAIAFADTPGSLAQDPVAVPQPDATIAPGEVRDPDQQSRIYFKIPVANEMVRLQTHFTVPPKPPRVGTMFLWPGLEPRPGGRNYDPIGLGVLQPVLTWGQSCAPPSQPPAYSTWWIAAMYVNVGNDPNYSGCRSGRAMSVKVGETLDIDMVLNRTTGVWKQTVTGKSGSVDFSINMRNQAQNMALFAIEPWNNARIPGPLDFSDTTITFRDRADDSCLRPELTYQGPGGRISTPTVDGTRCHIDSISVTSPTQRVEPLAEAGAH